MNLTTFNEAIENLDGKNKKAILAIIDLKVDNDMKDVLNKIDSLQKSQEKYFRILLFCIGFLGTMIAVFKFVLQ